ncbi:MAG: hypothetical protein ACYDER_08165 [Ktedonobacteraceae bacterium]
MTQADMVSRMVVEVEQPATSLRDECVRSLLIESVRLRVRRLKLQGGPDLCESNHLADHLGAEPLNTGKPLRTAEQFNLLAESIARLSFAPGGCRAFGLRFEAAPLLAERDDRPQVLLTKKEQRYWQALNDALQEAERTVLSWNGKYPRTGYHDIRNHVNALLAKKYPMLDDVERILLGGEVSRVIFEPFLEEYEAIYGGNLRQVWAAMHRR